MGGMAWNRTWGGRKNGDHHDAAITHNCLGIKRCPRLETFPNCPMLEELRLDDTENQNGWWKGRSSGGENTE